MPLKPRQRPVSDLELWLPNDRYSYFVSNGGVPQFQAATDDFSCGDAWRMAEASMLAYSDPAFARAKFAAAFDVKPPEDVAFIKDNGMQGYAVPSGDMLLLVFRGTELPGREFLRDMANNLDFPLVPYDNGHAHAGFAALADAALAGFRNVLEEARRRDRKIVLTGHSQGAAIATLVATALDHVTAIYTFGCPRVGDASFVAGHRHAKRIYRVVNNNDIVSNLPRFGGYVPLGRLCYLTAAGALWENPSRMAVGADRLVGSVRRLSEAALAWVGLKVALPDDHLTDHAPINYATLLWNVLAAR